MEHLPSSEKKGQKRKLEQQEEFQQDTQISLPLTGDARDAVLSDVNQHVSILLSSFSSNEFDRASAKRATHALADLAKNEEIVNVIVEGGAVPALIKHLQPPAENNYVQKPLPFVHEVEKGSSFTLGVLAVKMFALNYSELVKGNFLHN